MESNWRWLVYEGGWWGGPYPLIARRVDFPQLLVAKFTSSAGDGIHLLYDPGLGQNFVPYAGLPIPPLHPHFPFGWDVQPD